MPHKGFKHSEEARARIGKAVSAARSGRPPINAEIYRAKIRTPQLINRLTSVGLGEVEASAVSVQACIALLRKVLPDLATVEHTSEHGITLRTIITGVIRADDLEPKVIEHEASPSLPTKDDTDSST